MTTATFSEFARILGVRPSYVTKLREDERLVLTEDGKAVQVEASQQRIKETESGRPQHVAGRRKHSARRARGAAVESGAAPSAAPEPASEPPPALPLPPAPPDEGGATPAPGTRAYWERREAAARAETREIELAKLKGELAETEAVRGAGTEAGTTLRTVLENLVDQLAPILAAETEEPNVHRILREHMDQALHDIINRLETSMQAITEDKAA